LVKHDLVRGLKDVFEKDKLYSSCQAKKQIGNTHPKKSMMNNSKAFELLHMNLFGPTQYTSIGGNNYGFVTVDDYTRYTWIFFIVDKSDVFATFKSFVKGIHNEFETTIKTVRSDNDSEFKNTRIDELCDEFGIRHQFRPSILHNQMALLRERIEYSLIWQRSMLSEYNMSQSF
jgi:hypothetical protein